MAIELRKPLAPMVNVEATPVPLSTRLNLTVRRRRMRRLQHALGIAAWVGGGAFLMYIVAAGVLSLH